MQTIMKCHIMVRVKAKVDVEIEVHTIIPCQLAVSLVKFNVLSQANELDVEHLAIDQHSANI